MTRLKPMRSVDELFGVEEEPRNARDRLIRAAIDLCYAQGFHAVGLDQIVAEAGVTKTTFYKHFESKDDLLVAAVKKRDAWETAAWERAIAEIAGPYPRQRLLAMFDVLDAWFNTPEFGGCLFINAAAEFPNPHDPVHAAAAAHKRANRNAFRDLAIMGGADEREAETFADLYTVLIEGTLILRQVHGRDEAAQLVRPAAEQLIDRFVPRR